MSDSPSAQPKPTRKYSYSKYCRQPVCDVAYRQGWSRTQLAEHIGVSLTHLHGAFYGLTYPSNTLREALPRVLGVPLEELFHPNVLARTHNPHRPHRPAPPRGRYAINADTTTTP